MAKSIRTVIMRGGTSKALFLKEYDLPKDEEKRKQIILSLFGSPDKRQIDGLGGADPLTSKLAIIGPTHLESADITYTFAQVDIDNPIVDYNSLCGNISSAVGHFAVYEGYVPITYPTTIVKAYNSNLKRIIKIEVPVEDGKPIDDGDFAIPGVPGTGAKINVDLAGTAGGATGNVLPTGNPIDALNIPEFGNIEVSLVDLGNAHVFVRASDIGMTGTETPQEIDENKGLLYKLELIRAYAAKKIGMLDDVQRSTIDSPATPILCVVAEPKTYKSFLDDWEINKKEIDLVSRSLYMQITHKTYAGTSTACTGVASKIKGTIVNELSKSNSKILRIGHPAGIIETETIVNGSRTGLQVERAIFGRTARRLMEGYALIK